MRRSVGVVTLKFTSEPSMKYTGWPYSATRVASSVKTFPSCLACSCAEVRSAR